MVRNPILTLYSKTQTVFSLKEISMLFPSLPYNNLKRRLNYWVATGKLKKLRKNVYAKIDYNPLEIAQKPYMPTYISLDTVLQKEGVISKKSDDIYAVSHISRDIEVDHHKIIYRVLPESLLFDRTEVNELDGYYIASKERAFTDAVYIYKDYHFDNLGFIDWEKVMNLKKIYKSKIFSKRIDDLYEFTKSEK